jgi:hypothetical protein
VLRAPPHRTELIAIDELPDGFNDSNACSEELAEETYLRRQPAPVATRGAVHQALGSPTEVGDCRKGADVVVVVIVIDDHVGVGYNVGVVCHGEEEDEGGGGGENFL